MINIYHPKDPNKPKDTYKWSWSYLIGEAEEYNIHQQHYNNWDYDTPDIFVADAPKPTETIEVQFYNKICIAEIHKKSFGKMPPTIGVRLI